MCIYFIKAMMTKHIPYLKIPANACIKITMDDQLIIIRQKH